MIILLLEIPLLPQDTTWFGNPILSPNLILEVLIFIATCFAIIEFRQYRKRIRSESAVRALVEIKSCINYINEIISRTGYYDYLNYYPFKIPEIGSREEKLESFPERPARLIYNRIGLMQRKLNEPIAQLAGKEGKLLLDLANKLQRNMSKIGNFIGGKTHPNNQVKIDMDNAIKKSQDLMQQYSIEIETILLPIIEGKGVIFFGCRWLYKKCVLLKPFLKTWIDYLFWFKNINRIT